MDRREASERVAETFSRLMNATPSRFGVLADLTAASVVSGAVLVCGLIIVPSSHGTAARNTVLVLSLLPLLFSLVLSLSLRGSREKVVDWLATLPFPVENINALLAGTGDGVEVVFAEGAKLPERTELQPTLDLLSDDILFLAVRPDERMVLLKLGVIDSKRLPLRSNHLRYRRFVALVERVLLPLAKVAPIAGVRVT